MARHIAARGLAPLLDAARRWIDTCLIEDGSLFAHARPDGVPEQRTRFAVTPPEGWTAASFRGLYAGREA